MKIWRHFVIVMGLMSSVSSFAASPVDETFDTLSAGTNVFSKVTILNKTRNDVFFTHAKGMTSVKVKDLDPATQLKLGYQVEPPKPSTVEQVLQVANVQEVQEQLEADPRYQQAEAILSDHLGDALEKWDDRASYIVIGTITFVYLLFCFLCRCICVKTGNPPSLYIWLPLLKQIPLFKAAGMSPWWILSNFVPVLPLVAYVMWSFNIVKTRRKHLLFAVMLLLPLTNVIAFLYLALSGDGSEEAGNRGVISLASPAPNRAAA
jgi:hypothetical protein